MQALEVQGTQIASNVLETIVSVAIRDVPGVVSLARPIIPAVHGKRVTKKLLSKVPLTPSVEIAPSKSGLLVVNIHITVKAGFVLPDIATGVRRACADALATQLNLDVESVDVYIDNIIF